MALDGLFLAGYKAAAQERVSSRHPQFSYSYLPNS